MQLTQLHREHSGWRQYEETEKEKQTHDINIPERELYWS